MVWISQFEVLLGCAERETLKNLHVRRYQGGGGREEERIMDSWIGRRAAEIDGLFLFL